MTKTLKEINDSLDNSVRVMLEVPENTTLEAVETFLRPYQFEILNKDSPLAFTKDRTKVYVIRGSKPDYRKLEQEAAGLGYNLELDVKLELH